MQAVGKAGELPSRRVHRGDGIRETSLTREIVGKLKAEFLEKRDDLVGSSIVRAAQAPPTPPQNSRVPPPLIRRPPRALAFRQKAQCILVGLSAQRAISRIYDGIADKFRVPSTKMTSAIPLTASSHGSRRVWREVNLLGAPRHPSPRGGAAVRGCDTNNDKAATVAQQLAKFRLVPAIKAHHLVGRSGLPQIAVDAFDDDHVLRLLGDAISRYSRIVIIAMLSRDYTSAMASNPIPGMGHRLVRSSPQ